VPRENEWRRAVVHLRFIAAGTMRAGVQRKAQRNYNHAQQQQAGKERGMPPRRLQLKSFLLKFQQPCIYFFPEPAREREERMESSLVLCSPPPPLTIGSESFWV